MSVQLLADNRRISAEARPTLVVVDDEEQVLHSVHDLFRRDYRVLTFENGPDALEALGHIDPQVIMSDQRMPGMTGVEFFSQAKLVRPDSVRLLFTGYADLKAVIDAINEGNVFRFIEKPWDPELLEALVRQAFEHHALIAERKQLLNQLKQTNTQLVEANRLKSAFIEVASHELNTPVAVVMGLAELWTMVLGVDASPTEKAWVNRIQAAGKRLASTVERMMKLLRADRFEETLSLRPTNLEPLIHQVISDIEPFLKARKQVVEVRVWPGLGSAEVDPAKIGDVLTNLLVNAVKFSPDGAVIHVATGPEGPDSVWFRISDKGVGIQPDDYKFLFEPGFTGHDTLHHSSGEYQFCKKGMGLGLCLVKSFVELHGGTVVAASTPNEGSTFSFTLPRVALTPRGLITKPSEQIKSSA